MDLGQQSEGVALRGDVDEPAVLLDGGDDALEVLQRVHPSLVGSGPAPLTDAAPSQHMLQSRSVTYEVLTCPWKLFKFLRKVASFISGMILYEFCNFFEDFSFHYFDFDILNVFHLSVDLTLIFEEVYKQKSFYKIIKSVLENCLFFK